MTRERVKENLGAVEVKLSPQILGELDKAFPPPKGKQSLQML
jgi:diketogulonate reductase-like aldo/keto reductase